MYVDMNILYITKLDGAEWSGPSYSIPNQIKYQKDFDNVYWVNLCKTKNSWTELEFYHELTENKLFKICMLPEPFNKPDIVIVEQFYTYTLSAFWKELIHYNIPYIIVPRGEFTNKAQNQKKIKKFIANLLLMNKYINNAIAIQYLTNKECSNSKIGSEKSAVIIPNGIDEKVTLKKYNNVSEGWVISYIGRLDFYHKGLDLLILACTKLEDTLRKEKCKIKIYGPDRDGNLQYWKNYIYENQLEDILFFYDAVTGNEKEKVLLESDVFIMTSRFEGLPMGLIEALAYGIPCFVTSGTNMRDEIVDSNSGWGADENVDSIVKEMEVMLKEKNILEKKGECAKKLSDMYNWTNISKKSHNIYLELLRGCRSC